MYLMVGPFDYRDTKPKRRARNDPDRREIWKTLTGGKSGKL
jgi:hypothetical protein